MERCGAACSGLLVFGTCPRFPKARSHSYTACGLPTARMAPQRTACLANTLPRPWFRAPQR
eukprot:12309095-Alexandrium_andersonii.AAC.1